MEGPGKPPKFRKEILEADTKFGGMKLHNLELFDSSIKIGWLKRYIRSNSKWCVIPDDFELYKPCGESAGSYIALRENIYIYY